LKNNDLILIRFLGVSRETEEEEVFGEFDVFEDKDTPYSTFKFQYSERAFDRLASLMEFNTLLYKDMIFNNIKNV
jgi:phospholipase A2